MKTLMLAAVALTAFSVISSPALAFKCGSGAAASCACKGRVDCKDMRRSEMCKGDLTCGNGKCTCTAALMPADDGGEIRGGVKGVLKQGVLSAR